jgi:hypothetical protein
MMRNQQCRLRLGMLPLAIFVLSAAVFAQTSPDRQNATPVISDWTQNHVIFSKPANAERAKVLEQDFRYRQQQLRMSTKSTQQVNDAVAAEFQRATSAGKKKLKRDWAENMNSGASVGAGNYPAKYSFGITTAYCASDPQPDFVVYGTGLAGSSTQASVVAYDNLYSSCSGPVPTVYWAYNIEGGTMSSSPLFSLDGTQVAFVQTNTSGNGSLVLLKWAASSTETVSSPMSLTRVDSSLYPSCIAPCMTSEPLKDSGGFPHPDSGSSLFYAYYLDEAFVGDDAGWLHKISPVFSGVPAEVVSAGWPVQVNSLLPTPLTSPAYDPTSGLVFVADRGGFLYRVGPNTAFVARSGQLDFSLSLDGGPGITDGPMVNPAAELVYAFAPSDGTTGCVGGACSAVYELAADFPAGNTGQKVVVGASTVNGTAPNPLYTGGFDNTYRNSLDATGNFYVCGNTGGPPILYQVSIAAGVFSASGIPGPVLASSGRPACSPITDFLNPNVAGGPTDRLFVSVQNLGASSDCSSGGCIFNFKDTAWAPLTAYTVGQEILDPHFQIQVVTVPGTSGSSTPAWSAILGNSTSDGSVQWLNQGPESAFTPAAWLPSHPYSGNTKILDSNNNVELVTTPGNSGSTMPTFNATAGGTTTDGSNGLVWTNVGALPTAALPVSGGASGVVIDNTVTSAGGSQVYFSTLGNQPCGTSGAGGCAIQASQSALK